MKLNVEIIPADISNLTPNGINKLLNHDIAFFDPVMNMIKGNTFVDFEGFCQIHYKGNIYQLFKFDFEYVDPAIDYIKGYNIFNLDIERIAENWETVGRSYEIFTLQRVVDIEERRLFLDFLEIVKAITEATDGNILIEEYYGYAEVGLYDSIAWSKLVDTYGKSYRKGQL